MLPLPDLPLLAAGNPASPEALSSVRGGEFMSTSFPSQAGARQETAVEILNAGSWLEPAVGHCMAVFMIGHRKWRGSTVKLPPAPASSIGGRLDEGVDLLSKPYSRED